MDLAAARPEPIPVFAEMSSSNPVFILPRALAERGAEIAAGLYTSVTVGAGQFCTKPGLVMMPEGSEGETFVAALTDRMHAAPGFTMLHDGIAKSYRSTSARRAAHAEVQTLAGTTKDFGAMLFQTNANAVLSEAELSEEIFGPATVLVRHGGKEALLRLARALRGHLTATVHATAADLEEYAELLPILESKAGRVIINGFPTGVEVTHAMVHGGPYPATSSRETSVGTRAILRFVRPICFQDVPDPSLPPELQDANPLGIWRLLDGRPSREAVVRPG